MFDQDRKYTERAERIKKPNPGTSGRARHRVRLDVYEKQKTREHGEIPKATFRVVESTVERVGEECGDAWWINNPGLNGEYELGAALAFGRAIVASLGGDPSNTAMVRSTLMSLLDPSHPGRGIDVWCESSAATTKSGKNVVNCAYEGIPQTAEQIKAQRAELEAWKAGRVPAAAATMPAPQVTGIAAAPPAIAITAVAEPAPVVAAPPTPAAAPSLLAGLLGRP